MCLMVKKKELHYFVYPELPSSWQHKPLSFEALVFNICHTRCTHKHTPTGASVGSIIKHCSTGHVMKLNQSEFSYNTFKLELRGESSFFMTP
jgi:hypothetical protein